MSKKAWKKTRSNKINRILCTLDFIMFVEDGNFPTMSGHEKPFLQISYNQKTQKKDR